MSVAYERAGCAGLCPVDRMVLERSGRVRYDGYRNVPLLGRYAGRVDGAIVSAAFVVLDEDRDDAASPRDSIADARRATVSMTRSDGAPAGSRRSVSASATQALDRVRDHARLVAASWEDPYLGFYARDGGLDTLDVLTIEESTTGVPIAYGRTTRVDPCVPRGISDRAVSRGRLVRVAAVVRYVPERSEFDPDARPIDVRLTRDGLALRGEAHERTFARLSQAAYLARLDRFQSRVDAEHDAPCPTS